MDTCLSCDAGAHSIVPLPAQEEQATHFSDPHALLPMLHTSSLLLLQTTMTVRDALNSAMDEEMARDETVYVLGEEVCTGSCTQQRRKCVCQHCGDV